MSNKNLLNFLFIITFLSFFKINAQTTYCGATEYDKESQYTANAIVYFECSVWKASYYAEKNQKPGTHPGWVWESNCTEEVGCTNNYCGFPLYNSTIPYTKNSQVYYNGKIWNANYWANSGDKPGTAVMWEETGDVCSDATAKTLSIEDDLLKENITIHYNSNKIYYDFSKLENTSQIACYDTKGSLVFSKEVNNLKDVINLPSIKQGLYFLQVINNNAKTFKKIIVL